MERFRELLRVMLAKINYILKIPFNLLRSNRISWSAVISKNVNINYSKIGRYSYVGRNSILNSVIVANYSSIGPNVVIGGAEHSHWWYSTSHFISKHNIGGNLTVIGNDVWIGANVVIRQGIKIGDGAVIGAGSIVLKDVESFTIVVGNPSKELKKRFDENTCKNLMSLKYWNLSKRNAIKTLSRLNE